MKYKKIALLVVAAAVLMSFSSCQFLMDLLFGDTVTVTIEERIAAFEVSLNTEDQPDILDHVHPKMLNSSQLENPDITTVVSPLDYSNHEFIIGDPVVNEDTNVATCSFENGSGATGTIVFTMKLDGTEYKIYKLLLTYDGTTAPALDLYRYLSR